MEKKIIAVGDYIKKVDEVVEFPIRIEGVDMVTEIRVKKPMAEYSHRMMKVLVDNFGDRVGELEQSADEDFNSKSIEEKHNMLDFGFMHSCTLISSCCYFPDRDDSGNLVEVPRLIWEDHDAVAKTCPEDLFNAIAAYLKGRDIAPSVTEAEAKK